MDFPPAGRGGCFNCKFLYLYAQLDWQALVNLNENPCEVRHIHLMLTNLWHLAEATVDCTYYATVTPFFCLVLFF